MNDQSGAQAPTDRLDAELALLRERLRGARAPEIEGTVLPAALRARQARRTATASAPAAANAATAATTPPLPLVAAAEVSSRH
ncbi:MAG TPA: hypothetical protein VFO94_00625, partial [Gammaproteobacteria bacterium]|nr:hypothetical protein [Gammaproteobacteria bacterium]